MAKQVPAVLSALLLSSKPNLQAGFQTGRPPSWQTGLQTSHSNFKCLAQGFLSDLTSSFSYGTLVSTIFVSFPVPLTLFCLLVLVRAEFPAMHRHPGRASAPWLCHQSLHVLTVTYTILPQGAFFFLPPFRKAGLLTCLCYAMCLKAVLFTLRTFSAPPPASLQNLQERWGSPTLRAPILYTPLQSHMMVFLPL